MPGTVGSNCGRLAVPGPCGRATRSLGRLEGGLDLLLDLVEPLAGRRLVGLVDLAQALLHGLEPAALGPEELDPRSLDGLGVAGRGEGRRRLAGQRVQFRQEFGQGHGSQCRRTRMPVGTRLHGRNMPTVSPGRRDLRLRPAGLLRRVDDLVEGRRIADGHVGQDLAVQVDLGPGQAVDELAVAQAALAARRR